ncbi:MAG: hypothetical protein Q8O67_13610 [Deltaproteobacteria bacterium]|nr:hypothetical protein [Deltaproteobacteria bacterium]
MKSLAAVVVAVVVVACDAPPAPSRVSTPLVSTPPADAGTTVSAPVIVDDALLTGVLPPGPERELALGRCSICHSEQYLTQQRLTPAQWQKTVDKMRKWGAPLSDDEGARLALWLGRHYPVDLPERRSAVKPAPAGAVTP